MTMAGASQTNPNQVAACQGKEAFLGAFSAHRMLKRFVRRRKFRQRRGEHLRPFKCRFCGKWHLGSAMK